MHAKSMKNNEIGNEKEIIWDEERIDNSMKLDILYRMKSNESEKS